MCMCVESDCMLYVCINKFKTKNKLDLIRVYDSEGCFFPQAL